MLTLLALFFLPQEFLQGNTCLSPSFATRTGRETCWVQLAQGPDHKLCISHPLWISWLNHSRPPLICQTGVSRWKSSSLPWNSTSFLAGDARSPKKLRITGSIERLESGPTHWVIRFWQKLERYRERASQILAPYDSLGVFRSLVLHEGANREPLPLFRKLGFVHLISATGIHFYALMSLWDYLASILCEKLRIPVRLGLRLSRIFSFTFCFVLWLLSGARMGMLRAGSIIFMRKTAEILGFKWQKAAPLFLALFIEAAASVIYPWQSSHGRWIYALAVGGGLFFYDSFRSSHWGLAVGSWVLVAIWEIYHTGTIAIATPLISLVSLPVICLGIYPLLILGLGFNAFDLESLSHFVFQSCSRSFSLFIETLCKWAMYPGNLWVIPPWALGIGILISSIIMILEPSRLHTRRRVATLILVLLIAGRISMNSLSKPQSSRNLAQRIDQLDVGQGDAALVMGSRVGFVDSGSYFALNDASWIEVLAQRGVDHVDWATLTHLDEDHSGGLLRLARLIRIRCVITSSAELSTKRGERYQKTLMKMGIRIKDWEANWKSHCVPYPTLAPETTHLKDTLSRRNMNMGAILIPLGDGGFYLSAGDAVALDELRIGKWASRNGVVLASKTGKRILKVSHHGSKTSSDAQFLKLLRPTEAWISVGVGNRYGLPALAIIDRFHQLGIPLRRTDLEGVISTEGGAHHPLQRRPPSPMPSLHSERIAPLQQHP